MKRVLLSLPMAGIALYLITVGLYAGLSDDANYYPEPRWYSFSIAAWGLSLGLLLSFIWVRPSLRLLRAIAGVAFVPLGVLSLAFLWSGFRYGWELVFAGGIALTLGFCAALAVGYFCIAQLVAKSRAG